MGARAGVGLSGAGPLGACLLGLLVGLLPGCRSTQVLHLGGDFGDRLGEVLSLLGRCLLLAVLGTGVRGSRVLARLSRFRIGACLNGPSNFDRLVVFTGLHHECHLPSISPPGRDLRRHPGFAPHRMQLFSQAVPVLVGLHRVIL